MSFDREVLRKVNGLLASVCIAVSMPALAGTPRETAFVHVNVVPMDRDRLLRDQTVVVAGGVVTEIGAHIALKPGIARIDGTGKYLSPGLADMHTHSETREDMVTYLANGVTTVLNLGGASSDFVDQRVPLLNSGERPGPHVYVALRIDGTAEYGQLVVRTPEEARAAVRLAKANGYQFIKLYNNLSATVFAAAVGEARKLHLGIAGHYVRSITLSRELQPGNVLIAHLEELMYGLFKPASDDPLAPPSDAVIAEAASVLKANHGFVVADLGTFDTIAEQWGKPAAVERYFTRPEAKFVPYEWRLGWMREDYVNKSGSLERRANFETRLAKALNDRGIVLLAGTDAPTIPGTYPGFSLHDDLDRLVGAGLTPFQALSTATRNAGEYIEATIGKATPFGQIKRGYRADLILTDANPLEDLKTLRHPAGVMGAGNWHPAADLSSLLDSVKDKYARAAAFGEARH